VEDQRSSGLRRPPSTICSWTRCPVLPARRSGDCTDHRALYARGLVAQSASLEIWRLHRPPSIVCSGTGRPVRQFGDLGTAPTTEHCMLGDWSPSQPTRRSGGRTDHRALYARGLVDQLASLEELGTIPITKALSARD